LRLRSGFIEFHAADAMLLVNLEEHFQAVQFHSSRGVERPFAALKVQGFIHIVSV
jgi:hypothetical protein